MQRPAPEGVDRFDAWNIFLDDVVNAAFLGDASEVPVVHVARPEVFDNAVSPVGDSVTSMTGTSIST